MRIKFYSPVSHIVMVTARHYTSDGWVMKTGNRRWHLTLSFSSAIRSAGCTGDTLCGILQDAKMVNRVMNHGILRVVTGFQALISLTVHDYSIWIKCLSQCV